jgi:adenosine deaminase
MPAAKASQGARLPMEMADDVWRAVEELELDEVQHGIAVANSATVMRALVDNRIRQHLPTRVETHPIRKLYDVGTSG